MKNHPERDTAFKFSEPKRYILTQRELLAQKGVLRGGTHKCEFQLTLHLVERPAGAYNPSVPEPAAKSASRKDTYAQVGRQVPIEPLTSLNLVN